MKLLRGRFQKKVSDDVQRFSSSLKFDRRLYKYDIAGSIAHAEMLAKCKIISSADCRRIVKGLMEIKDEMDRGKGRLDPSADDIHMAIESRLILKIGDAGRKLHTGRSRNDQVSLDMRLYIRDEAGEIIKLIKGLQRAILKKAKENIGVIMPGYTHLQHAQPILFSHHLMAYFWMLERDTDRLKDALKRINTMPLGAGALAGTSLPIDRKYVARMLGFSAVSENSVDAVSDRDFAVEVVGDLLLLMLHLSRLSEEFVLWSTREFGFIEIDESFCTGSSIMPQKKNPDIPELIRGKTGGLMGSYSSLVMTMKGLPLSYNRDMQEDKEAIFNAIDAAKECLAIFSSLLQHTKINREMMYASADDGFSTATDLADYLAGKGVPFREAHSVVGKIVKYCIKNKKYLDEMTLGELRQFSAKFSSDARKVLELDNSVNSRKCIGGTARIRVKEQIKLAASRLRKK